MKKLLFLGSIAVVAITIFFSVQRNVRGATPARGEYPGIYNVTTTDVVLNDGYGGALAVDRHGRLMVSPSSSISIATNSSFTINSITSTNAYFDNLTIGISVASGTFQVATGTVSAPSIAGKGDTNTGVNWPGSDQLQLVTGGVQRMIGDANGNFAIGAGASPTTTAALTFSVTSSQSKGIALYNTSDQDTNYERGGMRWSSNVLSIFAEKGGTGSNRAIQLSGSDGTTMNVTVGGFTFVNPLFLAATDNTGFNISGRITTALTPNVILGDAAFGTPMSGSSGKQTHIQVPIIVNQSGSAGIDVMDIGATINTLGTSPTSTLLRVRSVSSTNATYNTDKLTITPDGRMAVNTNTPATGSITMQAIATSSPILTIASSSGNPVMQITAGGNTLFNTTTMSATVSVSGTFAVANLAAPSVTDNLVCVQADGDFRQQATNCTVSSARFKEHIESLSPEKLADIVRRLRAVSFDWKPEKMPKAGSGLNGGDKRSTGFIAEEVAIIDPTLIVYTDEYTSADLEFVKKNYPKAVLIKNGKTLIPQTVDYARVSVLLVGAYQNLDERVEKLEKGSGNSLTSASLYRDPSNIAVVVLGGLMVVGWMWRKIK